MDIHSLLAALRLNEVRCASCGVPFLPQRDALPLCDSCKDALSDTACACPKCGLGLPGTQLALCGECLHSPPPWQVFRMIGFYEGLLREMLLRAKFSGEAAVLALLGELLARHCADLAVPQAVLPVPLHPQRLRERGFNQCLEMARPLAARLHAPLRPDMLIRTQSGHPQRGLSRAERLSNLKNAFLAPLSVVGTHILLVDDIMTTGTTARLATQTLLDAGAASVDMVVAARAQP